MGNGDEGGDESWGEVRGVVWVVVTVVATVGGAGRACKELTIFPQHSEQSTLCILPSTNFP